MAFEEKSLKEVLDCFGEDIVTDVLSEFVCTKNPEVEEFIRQKAIPHETHGLAKTILIFDPDNGYKIVGYYTISTKSLILTGRISTSKKKQFFGTTRTNGNTIASILIGQLGKNEAVVSEFTGSMLMDLIIRYIGKMSEYTPSMIVYVEHDGSEQLRNYYERYGFRYFPREEEEREKGLFCHMIQTKDLLQSLR